MFSTKWQTSEPKYKLRVERDVKVPLSDGINLSCDVFRPDSENEKFPAILGLSPYGTWPAELPLRPTAHLGLPSEIKLPPTEKTISHLESGDPNFFVRRGYVHAICSLRGTAKSEGKYQYLGPREIQDAAEVVEWLAKQPWCDGNVATFGVSYLGRIQLYVASKNPPHLKCIFAPWASTDQYRDAFYQGGIMNVGWLLGWPRGGLSYGNARGESYTKNKLGEAKYKDAINKALQDPDISALPELVQILKNPDVGLNPMLIDVMLHPFFDEYWQDRLVNYETIKVPAYVGADWGMYSLHLPGAFRSWENLKVPKKMIISHPAYLDRPVYQLHYEALKWFDYWMKGIDTGIMEEPPIKLFITSTGEWKEASEWPLPETEWTPFYIHEGGLLSEHEHWPREGSDSFEDSPWHREFLKYYSPYLLEKTEVIGPLVLRLYASTTDTDAIFVVSFMEIDPQGNEKVLTKGWLRGSHREIDSRKSKRWAPYYSHSKSEPLVPDKIYEFDIPLIATGNLFKVGYRFGLRISGIDEPPKGDLGITKGHLRRQYPSRVTVYHDIDHPSQLFVPITKGNVIGTFASNFSPPKMNGEEKATGH